MLLYAHIESTDRLIVPAKTFHDSDNKIRRSRGDCVPTSETTKREDNGTYRLQFPDQPDHWMDAYGTRTDV